MSSATSTRSRIEDGQWYLHLFDPAQPDLNWRNVDVRAEFESILRFWLDRGVDGFRVDVAHGMAKADGLPDVGHTGQIELLGKAVLPYFDQDEVHEIHRSWRKILDSYPGDRMAVAEAWATSPQRLARYAAPDELHQVFNFDYLAADWSAPALRSVIDDSLAAMAPVGAPATWVLSNHDKPRHVTRHGDVRRVRAAILLMLALPGSAYVYQGEELGLPEVLDLPDEVLQDPMWRRSGYTERGRDGCRVRIPWSGDEPPYGFGPAGCWLPRPETWRELSVAAQLPDPASMLQLYRTAIALRRSFNGDLEWLDSPPDMLVFRRGSRQVCAVNFGPEPVALPPGDLICSRVPVEDGVLPADAAVWLA
jgi:alpha-glucosidase